MSLCYMNDKFAPVSECTLPVSDLVIQRGVGAFESIRLYDGRPFAMSLHLERLANSVKDSGIEADAILSKLPELIREGIRQPGCPHDGLAKPFITGGDVNNKGHFPQPRFFILFEDVHKLTDDEKKQGIALEPNRVDRPYPLVKSINYLFGLMPLCISVGAQYGISADNISNAMLVGKNFAVLVTPHAATTFLCIGLAGITIKELIRFCTPWLWALSWCSFILAMVLGIVTL